MHIMEYVDMIGREDFWYFLIDDQTSFHNQCKQDDGVDNTDVNKMNFQCT